MERRASAEIIHQLATLIHAGLTLSEEAGTPCETASPCDVASAVARTLALTNGASLFQRISLTARRYFRRYQTMIRTGELTGKLAECC